MIKTDFAFTKEEQEWFELKKIDKIGAYINKLLEKRKKELIDKKG